MTTSEGLQYSKGIQTLLLEKETIVTKRFRRVYIFGNDIRIRDVSIVNIILRSCFVCISIYFDQDLLHMIDILFHPVTCLNLTFSVLLLLLPFMRSLHLHFWSKI